MDIGLITILMFGTFFLLLALGVGVTIALGSVTVIYTYFLWGPAGLINIPFTIYNQLSPTLIAIPLFVLMANILQRSGIADSLYGTIYKWSGGIPGGLGMGTVLICAIFGALSGGMAAGTLSMGLIAIPSMLKRNYSKYLAVGCVAAGGVLGILIPPSIIMILYATTVGVSVGQLFMAGIGPGILVALMHMTYIGIKSYISPNYGPPVPVEERVSLKEKLASLKALFLPIALILSVLGAIYGGIATPTEAAAIGSFGAFICAIIYKRFSIKLVNETAQSTLKLVCMVMWILAVAIMFNSLYVALGGRELILDVVSSLNLSPYAILIIMHLILFLMGMVMDDYAIVLLAGPIFAPVAIVLGFDPILFGVLFIMNKQMAYLTPPFGFTLFYLKGITPKEIKMRDIYASIIPFVIIQFVAILIVITFPKIALWLPSLMH